MTPLQFAKHECANWWDGGCAQYGSCVLAKKMICPYFEEHVLPAAKWQTDKVRKKQFESAKLQYEENCRNAAV